MKELGTLVKFKNEKKLREPEHVKIKSYENDHSNEDSWLIKKVFPRNLLINFFENYTKNAFHL